MASAPIFLPKQPLEAFKILLGNYFKNKGKKKIEKRILGKIKELFTDDINYEVFRFIPLTSKTEIETSDEYVLLKWRGKIPYNDYWRQNDFLFYHKIVLIGINDDNKLFANLIDLDSLENIKSNLGFIENYNGEYICLPEKGVYVIRAQGDIVFSLIKIPEEEVFRFYKSDIFDQIIDRIQISLAQYFADKLLKALSDLRLSISDLRANILGISFSLLTPKLSYRDELSIKRGLGELMFNLAQEIWNDSQHSDYLSFKTNYPFISVENPWGANFTEFRITLQIEFDHQTLINHLKALYLKSIDEFLAQNLRLIEITYQRGNHIIKLKSFPTRLRFRFKNFITDRMETIFLDRAIFITQDNIRLEHNEHGITEVKLLKEKGYFYSLQIRNTEISGRDPLLRNKIILKKLAKERDLIE
jgi:hypothetical protein